MFSSNALKLELLSWNIFAYCGNNPVNLTDSDGRWGFPATLNNFTEALIGTAEALIGFESMVLERKSVGLAVLAFIGVFEYNSPKFAENDVIEPNTSGKSVANTGSRPGTSHKSKPNGDARAKGQPRNDHTVVKGKPKLPTQSKPNSSSDLLNDDLTVKQRRYYGPDGMAEEDIDFNHTDDGTHEFPHRHPWDWSQKTPRLPWVPMQ